MSEVVYGPSIAKNGVVKGAQTVQMQPTQNMVQSPFADHIPGLVYGPFATRIEASQKGWYAARALAELIEAIAVFETGDPDWDKYLDAKGAALRALKAFEKWHGRE